MNVAEQQMRHPVNGHKEKHYNNNSYNYNRGNRGNYKGNELLSSNNRNDIPLDYCKFVKSVLDLLDERDMKEYQTILDTNEFLVEDEDFVDVDVEEDEDHLFSDNDDDDDGSSSSHTSSGFSSRIMEERLEFSKSNLSTTKLAEEVSPSFCHKAGPLKKASNLIWKLKYVEVRKGKFIYYDDDGSSPSKTKKKEGAGGAKVIPLIAHRCTCRAVKIKRMDFKGVDNNWGLDLLGNHAACFELCFDHGPKRLWMVHSKEERKSWMQAIHDAMIGKSVTRADNFFEYEDAAADRKKHKHGIPAKSPYASDMEDYISVYRAIRAAKTKEDYLSAMSRYRTSPMFVPVEWVKNHVHGMKGGHHKRNSTAFKEEILPSSVAQLWKDLQRDSVTINGEKYSGKDGVERIVGQLARVMLELDRRSRFTNSSSRISEIQSVAFARDILFEGYTYKLKVQNICNIRCKSRTEGLTMRQAFRSTQENSFPQRTRLPTHIKAMKTILSLPAVQQLNQYHPEPAFVVVSCTERPIIFYPLNAPLEIIAILRNERQYFTKITLVTCWFLC